MQSLSALRHWYNATRYLQNLAIGDVVCLLYIPCKFTEADSIFDRELVNAIQGITTSLSAIQTFTHFEAYYV